MVVVCLAIHHGGLVLCGLANGALPDCVLGPGRDRVSFVSQQCYTCIQFVDKEQAKKFRTPCVAELLLYGPSYGFLEIDLLLCCRIYSDTNVQCYVQQ